jgi:4-hydroxy 2-oxovalerate aldolase
MGPVKVIDATLRDGSHAVEQKFSVDDVARIARRLDRAGVHAIEVGHGDGLGASSIHFGPTLHTDSELVEAAAGVAQNSHIAVVLIPGIGTIDDLESAASSGASLVRIATHCTEADIGLEHIQRCRDLRLRVMGFLMMAHRLEPSDLAEQATKMADSGAEAVYVTDTAGALTMDDVRRRISALRNRLPSQVEVGIHAHNNLGLAVANSLTALGEGATFIDSSLAGLGAGAGNTPTETLVTVLARSGSLIDVDPLEVQEAASAEQSLSLSREPDLEGLSLSMGFYGIPSSFLHPVRSAAKRFGVDARLILKALGPKLPVAGQEDLVLAVALSIAEEDQTAAPVGSDSLAGLSQQEKESRTAPVDKGSSDT